ncbi:hypothetical protein HW509_08810 [Asaia spathodeae]|uniref:hypothetical protein n=1 Tax=Asaia spathodeae TaxID=657016 RepID=UPI002FC39DE4
MASVSAKGMTVERLTDALMLSVSSRPPDEIGVFKAGTASLEEGAAICAELSEMMLSPPLSELSGWAAFAADTVAAFSRLLFSLFSCGICAAVS